MNTPVTSPAAALPWPDPKDGFIPHIGAVVEEGAYERGLRATFVAGAQFNCHRPDGTLTFKVLRADGAWVYYALNGDAEAADGGEARASLVECGRWLQSGVLTPLQTATANAA